MSRQGMEEIWQLNGRLVYFLVTPDGSDENRYPERLTKQMHKMYNI